MYIIFHRSQMLYSIPTHYTIFQHIFTTSLQSILHSCTYYIPLTPILTELLCITLYSLKILLNNFFLNLMFPFIFVTLFKRLG